MFHILNIVILISQYRHYKGTVFFNFPGKFIFDHFSAEIEWVSENCVFFSAFWKWVSEWSANFYGKKKRSFQIFLGKENLQNLKLFFCLFFYFWPVFGEIIFFCEWMACKLFLFLKEKKQILRKWELVSGELFRGKKYATFNYNSGQFY